MEVSLSGCDRISDVSLAAFTQYCSEITTINLKNCKSIKVLVIGCNITYGNLNMSQVRFTTLEMRT